MTRRYKRLADKLGIDSHLHALRHYSATELLTAGVDLHTVAGRLGHGDGTAAVRYYERNLGWTALPAAFADGTFWTIGRDPAAEAVPRCRALRLPDPFEPPFDKFHPF